MNIVSGPAYSSSPRRCPRAGFGIFNQTCSRLSSWRSNNRADYSQGLDRPRIGMSRCNESGIEMNHHGMDGGGMWLMLAASLASGPVNRLASTPAH